MFSSSVKQPCQSTEQSTARLNSKAVRTAVHLCDALQVTMSNWEASYLTPRQVRYAALDALVTSDAFRGLRGLHAAGSRCQGCLLPLGAWPGVLDLHCTHPECARKAPHTHILGLLQHMKSKQHESNVTTCAAPQPSIFLGWSLSMHWRFWCGSATLPWRNAQQQPEGPKSTSACHRCGLWYMTQGCIRAAVFS